MSREHVPENTLRRMKFRKLIPSSGGTRAKPPCRARAASPATPAGVTAHPASFVVRNITHVAQEHPLLPAGG
jgi:hypothetical protein